MRLLILPSILLFVCATKSPCTLHSSFAQNMEEKCQQVTSTDISKHDVQHPHRALVVVVVEAVRSDEGRVKRHLIQKLKKCERGRDLMVHSDVLDVTSYGLNHFVKNHLASRVKLTR